MRTRLRFATPRARTRAPTSRRILTREAMHSHFSPAQRCVVELFVFLRMGGSRDKVIVKLLDTDGANLPQALSKFNAANARCYLDADRQKLLAVVESSFGTFQPFNKLVRQIMRVFAARTN